MGDGADDCGGDWLSAGSSRSPQNSFLQVQRLPSGITVIGHCLGFKGNRELEAKEIFFSQQQLLQTYLEESLMP